MPVTPPRPVGWWRSTPVRIRTSRGSPAGGCGWGGVTGWQDAIVGSYGGLPDVLSTYLRAARSGLLSGRVVGALWWDRHRGVEQVPDLVARRAEARGASGT